MPRFWWVNQNQSYKNEVGGGYMWSPKRNQDNGTNPFYENMQKVRPGDLVFSFADTLIKTVGIISAAARSARRPEDFGSMGNAGNNHGWLVSVDYEELANPIKPKDHMVRLAPLLSEKYSPIRADGNGNQLYLAEIPTAMAEMLLLLIGYQGEHLLEKGQEREILNRTDIGTTSKNQLIQSRVGQGQYRKNLEQIEPGCRITGVTDRRFLIASHIKPWVQSNDFEKLDGNNGLFLSPHIDRLFDRGYISFQDDGMLLISSELPADVFDTWGLSDCVDPKPLNKAQAVYMDLHRRKIFKGCCLTGHQPAYTSVIEPPQCSPD